MSTDSSGELEAITVAYAETTVDSDPSNGAESSDRPITSLSSFSSASTTTEEYQATFKTLDEMKYMEKFFGYIPVWRPMTVNEGPKVDALEFFWTNSVFPLFSFLMSHLLVHTPEEPIPFLIDLVSRCLSYRDRGDDPPLLFEDSHISSLYTALDPLENGAITYDQYINAMTTLGLTEFNILPECMADDNGTIPKDVFLHEAKEALLRQLDDMLGKSLPVKPSSLEIIMNQNNFESDSEQELSI